MVVAAVVLGMPGLRVPGFDAVQAIEVLWRLESLDDVAVLARLLTADVG